MKKTENQGKLSLNKKFIANLNKEQLNMIKGGNTDAADAVEDADAADAKPKTWWLSRCGICETAFSHYCPVY